MPEHPDGAPRPSDDDRRGPARGADRRAPRRSRTGSPAVPVMIVITACALAGLVLWSGGALGGGGDRGAAPSTGPSGPAAVEGPSEVALPDLSDEEAREPDDLLAEGPVDAPVVLVVFTDFQCPYCAQWTHETAPVLRDYVERGDLRIEWRDVNVFGPDSERAARAALAAARQGEHVRYRSALFPDGEIRGGDRLTERALVDLAEQLGLDRARFEQDLGSEAVAETIAVHAEQGSELGAMSTPAFILAGEPLVGAQPAAEFTRRIDAALAERP